MTNLETTRFGRIIVDATGIHLRPILYFFGERFTLPWEAIQGWAVAEVIVASATSAQPVDQILELHYQGGMHFVQRAATAGAFADLIAYLLTRLPDKQTTSALEAMRKRQS